jgi:formylglycine-generating enzyme required for sulfatase activity
MNKDTGSLLASIRDIKLSPPERKKAGDILAESGDPRFRDDRWQLPDEADLGFVQIPAGPFQMGEGNQAHQVTLKTFYISRYPATVGQFQAFVSATGYSPGNSDCLKGISNHPVTWVSWYEARDYCRWLEGKLSTLFEQHEKEIQSRSAGNAFRRDLISGSYTIDLLSEAEWEKAARGATGFRYPWGSTIDPNRANYKDTHIGTTTPVGCFPSGASPYGILDMSGNVWNWTRTLWGTSLENPSFDLPYDPTDGREDTEAPAEMLRCMRGGAFTVEPARAEAVFRDAVEPNSRDDADGFRAGLVPIQCSGS